MGQDRTRSVAAPCERVEGLLERLHHVGDADLSSRLIRHDREAAVGKHRGEIAIDDEQEGNPPVQRGQLAPLARQVVLGVEPDHLAVDLHVAAPEDEVGQEHGPLDDHRARLARQGPAAHQPAAAIAFMEVESTGERLFHGAVVQGVLARGRRMVADGALCARPKFAEESDREIEMVGEKANA